VVRRGLLTRKMLRDLRRARAQTIALVGCLALGTAAFMAAIGAYLDLGASEARTFQELRFADAWFQTSPMPRETVDEIGARPGVATAVGRLVVDTGLPIAGGDRVRARLIGRTSVRQPLNDVAVIDGTERAGPGQVLVERQFAEARGIEPGDRIAPLVDGVPLPLTVAATVASPEYIQVTPDRFELLPSPSSFAVLFVDLDELQRASGQVGLVNDVAIALDERPGAQRVVGGIEADLRRQGLLQDAVRRRDQATYAALAQDLAAFRSVAYTIPSLILLAGVLSVSILVGRLVRSQRPLIGVMKALGYTDRTVLRHYLTYGLALGAAGSVLGVAAGVALGRVITRGYAEEIGVPFTESHFHVLVAALAVLVTLAAVVAASLRPAWTSARLAPATATRFDVAATTHVRRLPLERVLRLPLALRVSLRSITRAGGRAAGTATGIAAALILVLMILGLRDGLNLFLHHTFGDLERWDVSVTFSEPQPPAITGTVREIAGVVQASPFLQLPAQVETPAGRADVLLTALDPAQQLRRLRIGSTPTGDALAADTIVLTNAVAEDLRVGRDDQVRVRTPAGTYQLRVGATSDEPLPARAYTSLAAAAAVTGQGTVPVNGLYLRVADGEVGAVRTALYELPGAQSVAVKDEQRRDLESLLAIFTALIAVMLAFAVAMAFALVFNAMTVNVLEREREYATMRAVGARPLLIGRLLLAEATFLWAAAVAPGLLIGTWIAGKLGEAVAAGLFDLPVRISTTSYVSTTIGVLAVVVAALVPPLRRVGRLALDSSTKTLT